MNAPSSEGIVKERERERREKNNRRSERSHRDGREVQDRGTKYEKKRSSLSPFCHLKALSKKRESARKHTQTKRQKKNVPLARRKERERERENEERTE